MKPLSNRMPSTVSSSMPKVFDSSTVMTPSLPTTSIALAMTSPISGSPADTLAVWAISSRVSMSLAWFLMASTARSVAFSMPRLRLIGLAPAATLRRPSRTRAWASTVAVVVPSPAISSVFLATCLTSSAPIFSHGSSSSISLAMDTPSFVIVGAPHFFSRTTLRPLGPSVTLTASASWFIPRSRARRASSSKAMSLGIVRLPPLFGWLALVEAVSGLAIPGVSTQDGRVLSPSAITPLGPKSSGRSRQMRVAVVVFEGFDELDAIGPLEVLRNAAAMGATDLSVALVALDGAAEVTGSHGLRVRTDGRLDPDRTDLLVVPGGGWNDRGAHGAWAEAERGELPAAIAAAAEGGAVVATVCTGAMLAATAGLTRGRPAITHHGAVEDLRASGAQVVEARVVDDGDLVSAGGVTSGIDLALWLVERHFGADLAEAVAAELEHPRHGEVWRGQGLA